MPFAEARGYLVDDDVVRDASDEWIVASAIAGRADLIISGDGDLLVVGSGGPVPVLSPRQFWDSLQSRD